jgi:hypothetical protein
MRIPGVVHFLNDCPDGFFVAGCLGKALAAEQERNKDEAKGKRFS